MSGERAIQQMEVYPPGDWHPRPEPTGPEIDNALEKASAWWNYAVNHSDESIQSFLDLFERYLSGEVRRRDLVDEGPAQQTLVTVGGGSR